MRNFLTQLYQGPGEKPDIRKIFFVGLVIMFFIDYALQMVSVVAPNIERIGLLIANIGTVGALYQVNKKLEKQ